MNYQDPKTGRNKYIDRLVRQLHLSCRQDFIKHTLSATAPTYSVDASSVVFNLCLE
jgi:hypothetical protein